MDLGSRLERIEGTLLAQYHEAESAHAGDRGENREEVLRGFLSRHLPSRYGVAKGEILTRRGAISHSADVIIYDAIDCPVLYAGRTAVLPIEGVYGVSEVKSTMTKAALVEDSEKIESFKRLSPRDLSVIRTREYVTVHRPSRPFGIQLGFSLGDNSLSSLHSNVSDRNREIHEVNYFANLVAVLGAGVIHLERVDLAAGEKHPMLDTDEAVDFVLAEEYRKRHGEESGQFLRVVAEELGSRTFGRFFVYLLIMLERMSLAVPDLGRYLDPTLPMMIRRES